MNTIATQDTKTIIAAIDFSEASVNAAAYAAEMAMVLGKDLLLLHIVVLQLSYGEFPMNLDINEMAGDAEKELSTIKEQLIRKMGEAPAIGIVARIGTFFTELKTVCEEVKPYAVVMGSQGSTAVQRAVFGGHTVYAMQHLSWPLITVPVGARATAIRKIGLACDFDNMIYKVPVKEVMQLVTDFQAHLHVLHIGRKYADNSGVVLEAGLLRQRLSEMDPEYHFVTNEQTDEAIIAFAEENQLDLLVVLPKRRNLFEQLGHRSHTKQLVLHAHVPVMALHQ